MGECCDLKTMAPGPVPQQQIRILWVALFINAIMFFVELIFGLLAHSSSLLADSLDMFGDAFVFGFSLYVIGRETKWQNRAILLKGIVMFAFGLGVIVDAVRRFLAPGLPESSTMGIIGILALVANFICAFLLFRYRRDDMNMHSAWLCSRNDVLGNLGVMAAAGGVAVFKSKIPDLVVGIAIACLVLKSAFHVFKDLRALKTKATKELSHP